jgi:choice-of-anchor B domain-containing protein
MTQIGFLDIPALHGTELNDIWGYTDEEGNEYAIVGCFDGTSIVDISDPTTPVEILWIPGMNSIWRDIKTVGDYAYVTTEATEGLLCIDLSPLPESDVLPTNIYTGPDDDPWLSAHNLFADDSGYVYIAGANRDNGGIIILDCFTDPMNPIEVGVFDDWYAHDAYVKDDTAYFSHVSDAFFSIVDVTDRTAPVFINSFGTIDGVTHNAWASIDGDYIFTTDETVDGYIASYDVSDPLSITLLDQVQSSPGSNIIPHNAHVLGNYLITSYYTDGVVVHDINNPASMAEVASFDTSPMYSGGTFNGCWGVYPYFESEMIIASDTEEGLYVLQTDFLLAGYLEGVVTDIDTDLPINGVDIEIVGADALDATNVLGEYSTGTFAEGTFTVNYTRTGYYPETAVVEIENGLVTTQDIEMDKIPQFSVTVNVKDAETLEPIENAQVRIQHTLESESGLTDADGNTLIELVYEDNYQIYAGIWGYQTACLSDYYLDGTTGTVEVLMDKGIYDDFTFDLGWTISGDATNGDWEREVPVGVSSGGFNENPSADVDTDCADMAYITGNGSIVSEEDEVDGGAVYLTSPVFDLTDYYNPGINFSTYFSNLYGSGLPNDSLTIYLSNGSVNELVYSRDVLSTLDGNWNSSGIKVSDFMMPTDNMQLTVVVRDAGSPHLVEGAFDHFYVSELSLSALNNEEEVEVTITPNPVSNELIIQGISTGIMEITDVSGKLLIRQTVESSFDFSTFDAGIYLIRLYNTNGQLIKTQKQIKQ